jgi:hypothetical protein
MIVLLSAFLCFFKGQKDKGYLPTATKVRLKGAQCCPPFFQVTTLADFTNSSITNPKYAQPTQCKSWLRWIPYVQLPSIQYHNKGNSKGCGCPISCLARCTYGQWGFIYTVLSRNEYEKKCFMAMGWIWRIGMGVPPTHTSTSWLSTVSDS